ncbi:hypothetical protein BO70DRAFT_7064 [Aspergillus heteromorphus CBS 117.55]|uniref:Uncharacterized protein n=1 Tax=Aspergillus heteromorphus CBS 117.55 TaxID=1448321 RepID=A0A317X3W2_9EURO|nr:uncharacterized protein BO70DRAFT_7064 [Aspergillus heteromorphus CBS 117.55]PWY92302.1 hypothetical protein BO70DRAFT_7064 [Aspergillus heteromorphus CBS 117.55]
MLVGLRAGSAAVSPRGRIQDIGKIHSKPDVSSDWLWRCVIAGCRRGHRPKTVRGCGPGGWIDFRSGISTSPDWRDSHLLFRAARPLDIPTFMFNRSQSIVEHYSHSLTVPTVRYRQSEERTGRQFGLEYRHAYLGHTKTLQKQPNCKWCLRSLIDCPVHGPMMIDQCQAAVPATAAQCECFLGPIFISIGLSWTQGGQFL